MPTADDKPDCPYTPKIGEVEALLQRGFLGLRFPAGLERAYRTHRNRRAAHAFRHRALFILFLYLLLSSGIYRLMPHDLAGDWLWIYAWVGLIIIGAGVLARINALDDFFQLYTGFGSLLAVALSVTVTGILPPDTAGELTHTAIMYANIIIFSIVGLSFRTGLVAGWGGGAAGVLLVMALGGEINWEVTHRSYTGSVLLGMLICYLIEHADRRVYLQEQLLILLNQRTGDYARQLEDLSHTDALTHLSNRRHFAERAKHDWRRCQREQQPVSVLMIDADHFKQFNDSVGHIEGDQCLVRVAGAIHQFARRPSDLAVRYGGEEFLLWLPGTPQTDATRVAESIRQTIETLEMSQPGAEKARPVTISIGVASTSPGIKDELMSLIGDADRALYQAKERGRNRVVTYRAEDYPGQPARP